MNEIDKDIARRILAVAELIIQDLKALINKPDESEESK